MFKAGFHTFIINGHKVKGMLDTGATYTTVPKKYLMDSNKTQNSVHVHMYNGKSRPQQFYYATLEFPNTKKKLQRTKVFCMNSPHTDYIVVGRNSMKKLGIHGIRV